MARLALLLALALAASLVNAAPLAATATGDVNVDGGSASATGQVDLGGNTVDGSVDASATGGSSDSSVTGNTVETSATSDTQQTSDGGTVTTDTETSVSQTGQVDSEGGQTTQTDTVTTVVEDGGSGSSVTNIESTQTENQQISSDGSSSSSSSSTSETSSSSSSSSSGDSSSSSSTNTESSSSNSESSSSSGSGGSTSSTSETSESSSSTSETSESSSSTSENSESSSSTSETSESSSSSSGSTTSGESSGSGSSGGSGSFTAEGEASWYCNCFPADELFETPAGMKRADQLTVGDHVATLDKLGAKTYQPIETFYHKQEKTDSIDYIRMTTEGGAAITLSDKHLVPLVPCDAELAAIDELMAERSVYAQRAQVGQCLVQRQETGELKLTEIKKIDIVPLTGAYAPITSSGRVLTAEGILASCFAEFESHRIQHAVYTELYHYFGWLARAFDGVSYEHGPSTTIAAVRWLQHVVFDAKTVF